MTRTRIDYNSINWNEYFYYDETSPSCLRNSVDRYACNGRVIRAKAHDTAGSLGKHKYGKYWQVKLNGKTYKVHRIIFKILNTENLKDDSVIDHIDGNSSNNKISNLRQVVEVINIRNAKMQDNNTSGHAGVTRVNNGKGTYYWSAFWNSLCNKGKKYNIKHFSIKKYGEEEALRLAIQFRKDKMEELNAQGAGYSKRHRERADT